MTLQKGKTMQSSVLIFDTSIASLNLGDEIIMDSVARELRSVFPCHRLLTTLTHDRVGPQTRRLAAAADIVLVGGTNLLSAQMNRYRQWKISFLDILLGVRAAILLGVGWWQYQNPPNQYTKALLRCVLSSTGLHSVRDEYTLSMLKSVGLSRLINTGCPSMWQLTERHCTEIPRELGNSVVFTLTDYNKNVNCDQAILNCLSDHYDELYFWPQGFDDYSYLLTLKRPRLIKVLSPNLRALDELLDDRDKRLDYVGTRLHAGIRALQKKRRTIILSIDNRAAEKQKDFGLPVVPRENLQELNERICAAFDTSISLPSEAIVEWKSQFESADKTEWISEIEAND